MDGALELEEDAPLEEEEELCGAVWVPCASWKNVELEGTEGELNALEDVA